MALDAGTCSVDGGGVASGTGLARELYDAFHDHLEAFLGGSIPAAQIPYLQFRATEFTVLAAAFIDHITDNAEVTVTVATTDAGLQRTPDPNDANTDTQGPATDKELSGTVA